MAELIAKGDLKLEMRHLPLRPESVWAIEAVECAGDQGFWWAMHDYILANQAKGISTQIMKGYAQEMGLDTKAFDQCMDSDRHVKVAKAEGEAGRKLGVPGTPAFYINGKPLELNAWNDVLVAVTKELSK